MDCGTCVAVGHFKQVENHRFRVSPVQEMILMMISLDEELKPMHWGHHHLEEIISRDILNNDRTIGHDIIIDYSKTQQSKI